MRRAQRLAVLTRLLTDRPGVSYTLSQLAMRCGVSKPTISADVAELKALFAREELGELETVVGVNGGVRFFKAPSPTEIAAAVRRLCERLADPRRILPGGFLYLSDLISTPDITQPLAEAFAARFRKAGPEAVVTVETGGIPVAVLTARALAVPLVVARRTTRVSEGTVVTMNYFTGSARRLETMSLPLRALERGTRVLIIDDFMKAGGTARGLWDLMAEFSAVVVGTGVVIETATPARKLVEDYVSLAVLESVDEPARRAVLRPSDWLIEAATAQEAER